ncbi:hypothetical protein [Streptomyces althioticus]|jgi:hypothetical protein|uniref:hypothetical protein n=1 Tax=Streptomyces althioticus TaxID=83380 RepID=UPI0033D41C87
MAELSYEQLQARAIHNAERAYDAAANDRQDVAASLQVLAQTHALLAVGAAVKELARELRADR